MELFLRLVVFLLSLMSVADLTHTPVGKVGRGWGWNDTRMDTYGYQLTNGDTPKEGGAGVERYAAVIRIYTNLYVPDPYAHDGGTPMLNVVPCALRCDMCFPCVHRRMGVRVCVEQVLSLARVYCFDFAGYNCCFVLLQWINH